VNLRKVKAIYEDKVSHAILQIDILGKIFLILRFRFEMDSKIPKNVRVLLQIFLILRTLRKLNDFQRTPLFWALKKIVREE